MPHRDRTPLGLALLSTLSACVLPPAGIGLRSPGDVAEPGTLEAGAGVAAVSGGLSAVVVDVEGAVTDQVAVGGSVGLSAGPQGQAQVRWSTPHSDGIGFGVLGGVGVLTSYPAVGPYLGGTVRAPMPGGWSGYGGLVLQHLRVVGSSTLYRPTTWAQPVVGVCSAPGQARWGIEALAPVAVETGQVAAGVQAWLDVTVRSPK